MAAQTQPTDVQSTVTVILPALDEAQSVGNQVAALRVHARLLRLGVTRILVVDNGSTDATAQVAAAAGAQVVREPRRGYGSACLAGARAASPGDILLLMDADGSDDLDGAASVLAQVVRGQARLALGSRARGHADRGALTPQQRVGNALAATLLRPLAGIRVTDLGPIRAIRRADLLALDMREMTYGWPTEMLLKAGRAGYRVVEVPVDYHRRTGGRSKVAGSLGGTLKASRAILATLARYARWRPLNPISATVTAANAIAASHDDTCPAAIVRGRQP